MAENKKKNYDVLEDLKNIGLVLGGVVIGNLIDVGDTKILKLEDNVPLSGIAEMKKFISPAVRIVGGGAGAYFVPNKMARLVLGGVAISGATSVVNYGLNKVLNKNNPSVAGIGEIASEPIDEYRENMVLENYNPEFPELQLDEAREEQIESVDEVKQIEQVGTILKDRIIDEDEEFDEAEIM